MNLHGRGPESHRVLLAARPRRLLAFASAEAGVGGPAWRDDEHEVARWCRLLRRGRASPPTRRASTCRARRGAGRGGAAARRWSTRARRAGRAAGRPARFAAVARAERRAGRRVVVTGGPAERRLALRVAAEAGRARPATSWPGAPACASWRGWWRSADRVVCGDTGVGHLATALGTPSVVLFGPVPPARWGPPPDRPAHRALWAGGTGDPHADRIDPGLLRIGVDRVLDALEGLPQ